MDHALLHHVTTLPHRGAPPPLELTAESLGHLFGISDLPDRLAAVDDRITTTLGQDDALLGPASVRVAVSGGQAAAPATSPSSPPPRATCSTSGWSTPPPPSSWSRWAHWCTTTSSTTATRRGRPTINAVEGVNHAVLAGDYILAQAAELAARVSQEAASLIAGALGDLCEGQVLEIRDTFDPARTVEAHLASVHGKTAALFECACLLGAQCAGLGEENRHALARFGDAFGMGFQVLDDVLDLIGDEGRLGKPTGNDIASGVYTLPVLSALRGPVGDDLRRALVGEGDGRGGEGDTNVARAIEIVAPVGHDRRGADRRRPLRRRGPQGGRPPQPDHGGGRPGPVPPHLCDLGARDPDGPAVPPGAADCTRLTVHPTPTTHDDEARPARAGRAKPGAEQPGPASSTRPSSYYRAEGIAGISARAIARHGDFNQALIFYHFGSVEGLLVTVARSESERRSELYAPRSPRSSSLSDLVAVARRLHDEEFQAGTVAALTQMLAGAVGSEELARGIADSLRSVDGSRGRHDRPADGGHAVR